MRCYFGLGCRLRDKPEPLSTARVDILAFMQPDSADSAASARLTLQSRAMSCCKKADEHGSWWWNQSNCAFYYLVALTKREKECALKLENGPASRFPLSFNLFFNLFFNRVLPAQRSPPQHA